jgi:hypothetical protein
MDYDEFEPDNSFATKKIMIGPVSTDPNFNFSSKASLSKICHSPNERYRESPIRKVDFVQKYLGDRKIGESSQMFDKKAAGKEVEEESRVFDSDDELMFPMDDHQSQKEKAERAKQATLDF